MVRIKIILSLCVLVICSNVLADQTEDYKKLVEKYKAQYNFFSMEDSLFTIDSEYVIPNGYSFVESQDSSSYSFWVANFPIWHKYKAVGNWRGRKQMEHDEVSRVIHLPWQGRYFRDFVVPIRIFGEYNFQFDTRFAFEVVPKPGGLLTYKKWLHGKPAFNQKSEIIFKDDIEKKDTEEEYYKFLVFCMQNVSFESITKNCDTVAVEDVQPGDMFIGYDEKGNGGKLLIIFRLISNSSGDTMYLVANGCPDACDVHVPKINADRDNPWITLEQLQQITKDYSNTKFYRFRTINNNK